MANTKISIRPVREEDAEILIDILSRAFDKVSSTHAHPGNITPSVAREIVHSFIADQEHTAGFTAVLVDGEGNETIIGSNWISLDKEFGGVGPISVDPNVQAHGAGRKLMEAVIERRSDAKSIRLNQDAYNRVSYALYATLGFEVKDTICILHGLPAPSAFSDSELNGIQVRSYDSKDFSACVALCNRIYDVSREMDFAVHPSTILIAERVKEGSTPEIVGYSIGFTYFGHSVATDFSVLKALIREGGERKKKEKSEDEPWIYVFVRPRLYPELLKWGLTEAKLRVWGNTTLMIKGDHYREPSGGITLPSIMF